MNIAFLLTLYTSPDQANIFINQILDYPKSKVFIHIDRKASWIKEKLIQDERVYIIAESIDVEWGSFSHIESILYLFENAKITGDFDYFSIHSGHDLAIKPIKQLAEYLIKDNSTAYLDCSSLPIKEWGFKGGFERIELKWPSIFIKKIDAKSPLRYMRFIYAYAHKLNLIKSRKLPKDINFYGGSDWFTLNNDAVDFILNYLNTHPEFLNLFKKSLIGSEIFFNTLINNMPNKGNVKNNSNLRYIDWHNLDGQFVGSPKTLKSMDLHKLKNSEMYFARKFSLAEDSEVINEILKFTVNKEN